MAEQTKVVAQKRTGSGSTVSRRLRRTGWLPGVVNNEKHESVMIQIKAHDFEQMLKRHLGESLLLDMEIEGDRSMKVLLKEVQHHPLNGEALHVDFVEVSMTKRLRARVPVRLVGEAAGVASGGVIEQLVRELEVECLPQDLMESLSVDVSGLNIGQVVTVSQVAVGPNVTVLTHGDVTVAAVVAPTLVAEPTVAAAEAEMPALVGEKKEEEGKEEGSAEEEGSDK